MLVLTRKCNQVLVIGGEIRVTVLKTQGDSVRLGIEAPPHIAVHRSEVYQRILAETKVRPGGNTSQQDAA